MFFSSCTRCYTMAPWVGSQAQLDQSDMNRGRVIGASTPSRARAIPIVKQLRLLSKDSPNISSSVLPKSQMMYRFNCEQLLWQNLNKATRRWKKHEYKD